jgi:predicted transcriptional regulator
MTKRITNERRRKHEKIEKEFHAARLRLSDVEKRPSVPLEAYQILQEAVVFLRKKRVEGKISLDDVAGASGLDKAYLSRLENGKVINPTIDSLIRYASAIRPVRSFGDLVPG